jgi:hypothetical protein
MEEYSLPTNEATLMFEEVLLLRDPASHSTVDDRLLAATVLNEAFWEREKNCQGIVGSN